MEEGTLKAEAPVERHCIHHRRQVPGTYYGGEQYVAALQRLKASAVVQASRKVEPFFWGDARKVTVWLCAECAAEFGL